MKKRTISLLLAIISVAMLMIPTYAVEARASAQIAVYDIRVTTVTDKIAVYVTITGNGKMDKLGCESIYVYEMVGSNWVLQKDQTKLENDTGMSSTNIHAHADTIYCDGVYGTHYKVVVTIFGENSKGRDTRTETFYVTGK